VMCAHREPAYPPGTWRCAIEGCPPGACPHLRQSERAQDEMIALPLFHEMTSQDQERVVAALARATGATRLLRADGAPAQ
jgi:perosamine synthetase